MIDYLSRWSGVLALGSLILIVGALGLSLTDQTRASSEPDLSHVEPLGRYDGLELGVAFNVPAGWPVSSFQIKEEGAMSSMLLQGGHSEIPLDDLPLHLPPGESYARVLVENPTDSAGRTREERLESLAARGHCPTVGERFPDQSVIYYECFLRLDGAQDQVHVIEATFFREEHLLHVMGMGARRTDGSIRYLSDMLITVIESMTLVDYSEWTERAHPEQDFVMSYPSTFRLHDSRSAYSLIDTGLDRWVSWQIIYDDPTYAAIRTVDEGVGIPTTVEGFDFDAAVEPPRPLDHQSDRQIAVWTDQTGSHPFLLLSAAVPNPDRESPMPVILFRMIVPEENLERVQPVFEQVVRAFRSKTVPLIQ